MITKVTPSEASNQGSRSLLRYTYAVTAGPWWMRLLYIVVALTSFGWFGYTCYELMLGVTSKQVTDVTTEVASALEFPDIYICLPAHTHFQTFRCCGGGCDKDTTDHTAASAECGTFAVANLPYGEDDTQWCESLQESVQYDLASTSGVDCRFRTYTSSVYMTHPWLKQFNMGVGPQLPYGMATSGHVSGAQYAGEDTLNTTALPTHEFAIGLANKMPTYTPPTSRDGSSLGVTSTGYCWYYQANAGASFSNEGYKRYLTNVFATSYTEQVNDSPPYFEVYLMEAGKAPYEGDSDATTGKILASKKTWPGIGSKSIGSISVDYTKDETKGETEFTPVYRMSVVTMPLRLQYSKITATSVDSSGNLNYDGAAKLEADDSLDPYLSATDTHTKKRVKFWYTKANLVAYGVNTFTFDSFFIRKMTTRYQYSFFDAWAAIGGLYGGSLMILTILFSIGHVPDLQEVNIFRFLPKSVRAKWLQDVADANPDATDAAPSIKQLQAEIAELRAQLQVVAGGVRPAPNMVQPNTGMVQPVQPGMMQPMQPGVSTEMY